jgi:DNA-directed RNA polymerase subunit RPC12/RpoP
MSQDNIEISFRCKKCGTTLTWPDDATDDSAIQCSNCGESFGTYKDLREAAVEAAKEKVDSMLGDIFKKR